jgi:hypothetical protein
MLVVKPLPREREITSSAANEGKEVRQISQTVKKDRIDKSRAKKQQKPKGMV